MLWVLRSSFLIPKGPSRLDKVGKALLGSVWFYEDPQITMNSTRIRKVFPSVSTRFRWIPAVSMSFQTFS